MARSTNRPTATVANDVDTDTATVADAVVADVDASATGTDDARMIRTADAYAAHVGADPDGTYAYADDYAAGIVDRRAIMTVVSDRMTDAVVANRFDVAALFAAARSTIDAMPTARRTVARVVDVDTYVAASVSRALATYAAALGVASGDIVPADVRAAGVVDAYVAAIRAVFNYDGATFGTPLRDTYDAHVDDVTDAHRDDAARVLTTPVIADANVNAHFAVIAAYAAVGDVFTYGQIGRVYTDAYPAGIPNAGRVRARFNHGDVDRMPPGWRACNVVRNGGTVAGVVYVGTGDDAPTDGNVGDRPYVAWAINAGAIAR